MENQNFDYFYLYGKTSNLTEEGKEIIIYTQIGGRESKILRSLEGIFFSDIPLNEKEKLNEEKSGYLIKRGEMEEFENKYSGKFVGFEE